MGWIFLRDVVLFAVALGGLSLPWLPLLRRWPEAERPTLAVGLGLIAGYLAVFAAYGAGARLGWFWLAPLAGWIWTLSRQRPATREFFRDSATRAALKLYAIVALWCLGCHALIVTYSGAAWQVDWWEHYDRTHFFLAHWPLGFRFADIYPLTARPPLVNLWSAALLSGSGGAFYHHQIFLTLLSCLVVLPLAALVQRWRGTNASLPLLALVLMACPVFMQNATFPWTKLVAAFFVLAAWLQLTATRGELTPARYLGAALALAAGVLAHYSVGPWICALALAWIATRAGELRDAPARRAIGIGALAAALLLATWIGWAVAHYGWRSTFADNTTVSLAPGGTLAERAARAGANLFHTLWPVSTVGLHHPMLAQDSALGRLRDQWFILYQLKLWWTLGLAGGVVLVAALWRERPGRTALFATVASVAVILIGTVTHSQPDVLGLAHIALQPLTLLALAWLVARADGFPRGLRWLWGAGLAADFALGVALHFGVQSGWLDRWLRSVAPADIWRSYTQAAAVGFENKVNLHLTFLADLASAVWAGALLAAALFLLARFAREMTSPDRSRAS